MRDLTEFRDRVNELKAEQRVAKKMIASLEIALQAEELHASELEVTQEVFQIAVKLMYNNLSTKLGKIITEGLTIVFPETKYKFIIEFVDRRNSIEADMFLEDEHGNRFHPTDAVGGGISDFVSLLLRISFIIISTSENFLLADEPLKFVSRKKIPKAAAFIKQVCTDSKFQLVFMSHIQELIDIAEVEYNVTQRNGISSVEKV